MVVTLDRPTLPSVPDSAQRLPKTLLLRCAGVDASTTWSPLSPEAPHPSWVRTIFNEFGTHDPKK